MLLAAGLGTRLRPLTDHTPKALVEVGGIPILERIARDLIAAGADRLIINLHHLGDQIRRYVEERDGFGAEAVFSPEPEVPLETGGGLLRAEPLFRKEAPFFLHNTDVFTDLSYQEMYRAHCASGGLATLATMRRESSRYLLFDDVGLLGRVDERKDLRIQVREPSGEVTPLAFAGVHVISPEIFDWLAGSGPFSILEPYLRAAEAGERILPYRVDGARWIDIGKPEQLREARRSLERSLPDQP